MSVVSCPSATWKLELSGRQVRAVLEHGLTQTDRQGGGFLQISGARIVWDPGRPRGQRLVTATVGGRLLADDAVYTVAVPSYLVRGGDGFLVFAQARVLIGDTSAPQLLQTVLDSIAARGTIAPAIDGRITASPR
jgi:5'-nucleotidase / UDP-sugar diphosphatase